MKKPVTLITGYLGSEKTTLLNEILRSGGKARRPHGRVRNQQFRIRVQEAVRAGRAQFFRDGGCLLGRGLGREDAEGVP